jgi:uncharacterized protein
MMTKSSLIDFEHELRVKVQGMLSSDDPAHDLLHIERVVAMAKRLARSEQARLEVVVPAAWLHDCVNVPKNHPNRSLASRLSAEEALRILSDLKYPRELFQDIAHAIEAHSFSAGIEPLTPEARVVQDADRLDALGSVGIARCFAVAGMLKRPFYSENDPFCETRSPDDARYSIDHFFVKLFKVADSLKTEAGREEGRRRVATMRSFLRDLRREIEIG